MSRRPFRNRVASSTRARCRWFFSGTIYCIAGRRPALRFHHIPHTRPQRPANSHEVHFRMRRLSRSTRIAPTAFLQSMHACSAAVAEAAVPDTTPTSTVVDGTKVSMRKGPPPQSLRYHGLRPKARKAMKRLEKQVAPILAWCDRLAAMPADSDDTNITLVSASSGVAAPPISQIETLVVDPQSLRSLAAQHDATMFHLLPQTARAALPAEARAEAEADDGVTAPDEILRDEAGASSGAMRKRLTHDPRLRLIESQPPFADWLSSAQGAAAFPPIPELRHASLFFDARGDDGPRLSASKVSPKETTDNDGTAAMRAVVASLRSHVARLGDDAPAPTQRVRATPPTCDGRGALLQQVLRVATRRAEAAVVWKGFTAYTRRIPRGAKNESDNALQELALCEHAAWVCRQVECRPGWRPKCIIDAGGGNGILAFLAGERLGCESIVVDFDVPPRRVDAPPENGGITHDYPYFRRISRRVGDVDWRLDVRHRPEDTLIITKHLCGSGVDELLRSFELQGWWPEALVVSSCCHFKCRRPFDYIHWRHLERMRLLPDGFDFRSVPPEYAGDADADNSSSASDGCCGASSDDSPSACAASDGCCGAGRTASGEERARGVELLRRVQDGSPAWYYDIVRRTGWIAPERPRWMAHVGSTIEAVLDAGRVLFLRERGYAAQMVPFIVEAMTPRNCALLAWRRDPPRCGGYYLPVSKSEQQCGDAEGNHAAPPSTGSS